MEDPTSDVMQAESHAEIFGPLFGPHVAGN